MYNIIEQARAVLVAVVAVIISTLAPTKNALIIIMVCAFVNAFIGYQTNSIIRCEPFSFRKMWRAVQELVFYAGLTVLLHITFYLLNEAETAETAVKIVCWIGVWGYLVNTLQNIKEIFPKSKSIRLIYYILSVKFLPFLAARFGFVLDTDDFNNFDKRLNNGKESAKGDPK